MADQPTLPFRSTPFASLLLNRFLDSIEDATRFEIVSAPAKEVEVPQEDTRRVLIDRKNFGCNELLLANLTAEDFLHRDRTLYDMRVGLKRGGHRIDENCHVLRDPVWVFFEPMEFGSDDVMHMPLMELTPEHVPIPDHCDLCPAPKRLRRVKTRLMPSLLSYDLVRNLVLEVVVPTHIQVAPLNQADEFHLDQNLKPFSKRLEDLFDATIELALHLHKELRSRQ